MNFMLIFDILYFIFFYFINILIILINFNILFLVKFILLDFSFYIFHLRNIFSNTSSRINLMSSLYLVFF